MQLEKYYNFINSSISNLKKAGAYIPRSQSVKSTVKPLWWMDECEDILRKKKLARKAYIKNTLNGNLKNYLEVEKEASKVLLVSKKKSFKDLCNSINPTMECKRI